MIHCTEKRRCPVVKTTIGASGGIFARSPFVFGNSVTLFFIATQLYLWGALADVRGAPQFAAARPIPPNSTHRLRSIVGRDVRGGHAWPRARLGAISVMILGP